MIVKAFQGLRPRRDLADRIPSYPYDVLDTEEARRLAADDPYSFLHVVRSEIDLEPGIDPHDDRVYTKAGENFRAMIDRGWLQREAGAAFYVYRLQMGDHVQTGVVGVAAVEDYLSGRIKRHEDTRPEKELDRVRHTEALSAHPGPVFMAYRESPDLEALVAEVTSEAAEVQFIAHDGIGHTLWVVSDPGRVEGFEAAFQSIGSTYIADGHHRAAAYARVAKRRRGTDPKPVGAAAHDYFLAAHFPAAQLRILDYNRVVRDLNGLSLRTFLAQVREAGFYVKENWDSRAAPRPRNFGMYIAGHWYLLTARPEELEAADPVRGLDVSVLTERLLQGVLGIQDPRTDPRIDFVGGIRGMEALEQMVDSGRQTAAFSLYPPTLEEVMAVADRGLVMPPKSTWFEPKLRSGMVIHPFFS